MGALRFTLSILSATAAGVGCAAGTWTPRVPTPGQPTLAVVTYNVNLGLAGDPITLAAILASQADVIFLQETTPEWEAAIRPAAKATYPHIEFRHCCRAGGLAVLSRFPFEDAGYFQNPTGWFPAWRVMVHTPLGDVQALQVHLRPPISDGGSWVSGYFTTGDDRLEEITGYHAALDPDVPAIVLGDFNEESGDALDFLTDRGFTNITQQAGAGDTWRWPTPIVELSLTLDHVLHTRELTALDVQVLQRGRSDHLPVRVVFQRAM